MKNIHEILAGLGITIPEEKKTDFDKELAANYKTVPDYEKQVHKLEQAQESLETAQNGLKAFEGVDIGDLKAQITRLTGDLAAKESVKRAQKIILEKFKGKVFDVDQDKAYVNKTTAGEYTYPANRRQDREVKAAKLRATPEIDNMALVAKYINHAPDDGSHPAATGDWDNYETPFKVGEQFFAGTVKVKNTNRSRVLYDIG